MKSRIFALFSLFFLISACSLPGGQTENVPDGTVVFSGTGFSLRVPEDWTPPKSADMPTPVYGKIVYASLSPEVKYGFASTLLVIEDELKTPATSRKYSELNNAQTTKNYLEYTKIAEDALLFGDSDESKVYTFEARYNMSTPRLKFVQTAKVCGTKVYLLHAALSLDKETKNYIDLFRSFACK
jgi:hypothetical protein